MRYKTCISSSVILCLLPHTSYPIPTLPTPLPPFLPLPLPSPLCPPHSPPLSPPHSLPFLLLTHPSFSSPSPFLLSFPSISPSCSSPPPLPPPAPHPLPYPLLLLTPPLPPPAPHPLPFPLPSSLQAKEQMLINNKQETRNILH